MVIGLIIGMIGNLLLFVASFFMTGGDLSTIFGLLGIGIIAGIGGFIVLIGALLIVIGRKEFGEKHQKNTIYAVIVFIVSVVVGVVLSMILSFMTYATTMSSISSSDTISYNNMPTLIVGVISAILGGVAYYFLLVELEDERGKNVLYAAIASSIAVTAFISYLSSGITIDSSSITSSLNYTAEVARYGVFSIISAVVLLFAVYIPYRRINDGELVPKEIDAFITTTSAPGRVCPNCNREIPTDAKVCPYCGKSFESYL